MPTTWISCHRPLGKRLSKHSLWTLSPVRPRALLVHVPEVHMQDLSSERPKTPTWTLPSTTWAWTKGQSNERTRTNPRILQHSSRNRRWRLGRDVRYRLFGMLQMNFGIIHPREELMLWTIYLYYYGTFLLWTDTLFSPFSLISLYLLYVPLLLFLVTHITFLFLLTHFPLLTSLLILPINYAPQLHKHGQLVCALIVYLYILIVTKCIASFV